MALDFFFVIVICSLVHERIGKARNLFPGYFRNRLLISVYGPEIEICLIQDNGQLRNFNNAQRHDSMLTSNYWLFFSPTLVFAGHYL